MRDATGVEFRSTFPAQDRWWDESCHFWYTRCTVRSTLTNTRSRVTNIVHSTPTIYLEQLSARGGQQQLHELTHEGPLTPFGGIGRRECFCSEEGRGKRTDCTSGYA